jgi:hypothetical protein
LLRNGLKKKLLQNLPLLLLLPLLTVPLLLPLVPLVLLPLALLLPLVPPLLLPLALLLLPLPHPRNNFPRQAILVYCSLKSNVILGYRRPRQSRP